MRATGKAQGALVGMLVIQACLVAFDLPAPDARPGGAARAAAEPGKPLAAGAPRRGAGNLTEPRYLFIDRQHLESMDGIRQVFHQPVKHKGPVVLPDRPWEDVRLQTWTPPLWSEERSRWRVWYFGSEEALPLYAESSDGLTWDKPLLGLVSWKGSTDNNIIDLGFKPKDSKENWLALLEDDRDPDPARRFKGLGRVGGRLRPLVSADGLSWKLLEGRLPMSGDQFRLNYDELKRAFVATIKTNDEHDMRAVALSVSGDFVRWSEPTLVFWGDEGDQAIGRKRMEELLRDPDRCHPQFVRPDEFVTDIYNMPVFTYADLYLGLPVMSNQSGGYVHSTSWNNDGILSPSLVASRDLRNWERLDRRPFIPLSRLSDPHNWDYGMIQANRPVRNGDELWFYYVGTRFTHLKREVVEWQGLRKSIDEPFGAIFLARLRLDGFASLHAGDESGVVMTKSVKVTGPKLFMNLDASQGELRAEILDAATCRPLPGYSMGVRPAFRRYGPGALPGDDTIPLEANAVSVPVRWRERQDVSTLVGRQVRVRFRLRNAHLYSFWFGDSE